MTFVLVWTDFRSLHDLGIDTDICVIHCCKRSECICAFDIDSLDIERELDATRAHVCIYRRSIHINPYITRTRQGVCMYCIQIPTHRWVSVHGCEQREAVLAHTKRSAVLSARAHGHVGMHGRGTDIHPRRMLSPGAVFIDVTMYRSFYIGHIGGERDAHLHKHPRSSSCPHARARMQRRV